MSKLSVPEVGTETRPRCVKRCEETHLGASALVKHTHDEIQYIQPGINYESPALLAMHQFRRRRTKTYRE